MGQKIHPLGFRLGITQAHRSHWFAKASEYPQLFLEDLEIRQHIESKYAEAGIARLEIQRKADRIEISLKTAKPGILVGRSGTGIETLRKELQEKLLNRRKISIHVSEIANPDAESSLLAEFIVQQLEKRTPFRRAVRQAIQRAQRAGVEGIKVQVSGRLNGAEIARSEWIREGRVPLHTIRADIDYSYSRAQTIYGVLGVKVWIFKGEIIPALRKSAKSNVTLSPTL